MNTGETHEIATLMLFGYPGSPSTPRNFVSTTRASSLSRFTTARKSEPVAYFAVSRRTTSSIQGKPLRAIFVEIAAHRR